MEGADCAEFEGAEQAVLLVDEVTGLTTVVQPNEDGSYWRKIVRNKMIRMKEKRRVQAGKAFAKEYFGADADGFEGKVVSSWGPYTSIVGTAVTTGVAGLTTTAEITAAKGKWDDLASDQASAEPAKTWAATGSELAAAFRSIDKNGSGLISFAELADAIKAVDPEVTEGEVANMVRLADADNDGKISLQEFVMLMLFQHPAPVLN